jgi:hypothetical protein
MCKIISLLALIADVLSDVCSKNIHFADFLTRLKVFGIKTLEIHFLAVMKRCVERRWIRANVRREFIVNTVVFRVGLRFIT